MKEQALLLGRTQPVVGVVTEPLPPAAGRPAVVLLNSGLTHHVGPERLYVRIARRLAAHGCLVARIDHRGIGDSDPRRDGVPFFAAASDEIVEVLDQLEAEWGATSFVLGGICSGAEFAFAIAQADERVTGAVLINGGGQAGSERWQQHVKSHRLTKRYGRSVWKPEAWLRALTGRVEYRTLFGVLSHKLLRAVGGAREVESAAAEFADRFEQLVERGTRLLMIHAAGDDSLAGAEVVLGERLPALTATGRLRLATISGSDHTFTLWEAQQELIRGIEEWLVESWPAPTA